MSGDRSTRDEGDELQGVKLTSPVRIRLSKSVATTRAVAALLVRCGRCAGEDEGQGPRDHSERSWQAGHCNGSGRDRHRQVGHGLL